MKAIDQRMILENMLMEGKIDEAKLTDMLKGIWQRLKNAIATAWAKLTKHDYLILYQTIDNMQSNGGIELCYDSFELEPVLSVNTKVKF